MSVCDIIDCENEAPGNWAYCNSCYQKLFGTVWKCFHCGEEFTYKADAALHFGATQDSEPGCIAKLRIGGERGLLESLRAAEERLAAYSREDTEMQRAALNQQQRHSKALFDAEIMGYERGLRERRKS